MIGVITWVATRTGLSSLLASVVVYAVIAALGGGAYWAWSAHRYNAGYSAGELHERQVWEGLVRKQLAKQAAKVAADQAQIDALEAENLALQAQADKAEADLEEALKDTDRKPVLPKHVGAAINEAGR